LAAAALPWALLAALFVHCGAHLVIAAAFVRRREWKHALLAFFVPPLAPWWGWRAGMRRQVYVWSAALAVYALGVAVASI
jgi:hypothetical protein